MLDQVLETIKETDHPVSLHSLSKRLKIEQGALSGMLALLVRKGKLKIEHNDVSSDNNDCGIIQCMGCVKENSCPFIAKMPVMYAIKEEDHKET